MLKTINKLVEKIRIGCNRMVTKHYLNMAIMRLSNGWYGNFDKLRSDYCDLYQLQLMAKHLGEDKIYLLAFRAGTYALKGLNETGKYTFDMWWMDRTSTKSKVEAMFNQSEEAEAV